MFLVLAAVTAVTAQTPSVRQQEPEAFVNRQRQLDARLREEFDAEVGAAQRALFDWGGWYSSYVFLFDDGVESSRTLRRNDLRFWSRVVLDKGAHEFYARARLSLVDFNTGDAYDGNDDDVEGPNLERGYYRFDLAKAAGAYQGRALDYNLVVTAGRDLVEFGGGTVLATPLDHVAVRGVYRSFELTGLFGRTVGSTPDFDISRTATRSHREFAGAQLKYLGFERHEPYAYALWQHDRNVEAIYQPFQKYAYDSAYAGIGSSGELSKGLRYGTEFVYEDAQGFGAGQFLYRNDVSAWAVQCALEYLFPGKNNARTSIEYVFGSGDADRFGSPTATALGNRGHFSDTTFIGFGYNDTGLAFAPGIENLHMWRAGASYYPWPDSAAWRRVELGTDWYLFHKHHRDAAVSDPTSDTRSGYLGWEMDYYVNCQLTADLFWTTRWGIFFPGAAFSDTTTRTFFVIGLTWSF